jgi:23S rRNA (cytosine1962-C5)-methyltransferase
VLVVADVFGWLEGARARKDRFDLIVLDPPSYATARGVRFSAESDYRDLAARVFQVLAPGGTLMAFTNHKGIARLKLRRWLYEAARDGGTEVVKLRDLAPPVDFPPAPGLEPHLKGLLATVR